MENDCSQEYDATEQNQESMPPLMTAAEYNNMYAEDPRGLYSNYHRMNSMQGTLNHSLFAQPFLNQMGYPMLINLNSLPSMLNDNRKMLNTATKCSHEGEIDEAIELFQRIHKNLIFLANAADLQSNSRFILRQERELLSQKDLTYFDSKFGTSDADK